MPPLPPRLRFLVEDALPAGAAPAQPLGARLRPWVLTLVLLPFVLYLATHRGTWTLLDYADLIVHEAGHVFFRVLGFWMGLAGGTLLQLLLPAALAASFVRQDYRPGAQLMLVWLGQSLGNASVYAADARARALPLLGGDAVLHDWHTMLAAAGLLHLDAAIGHALFGLALLAFAAALTAPRWMQA